MERLQVGYYFDFASHPFAHAALFDAAHEGAQSGGTSRVHEALHRLPAYLTSWFRSLRDRTQPGQAGTARLLARVGPPRAATTSHQRRHGPDGGRLDDRHSLRWFVDGEHLRQCLSGLTREAEGASDVVEVVVMEEDQETPALSTEWSEAVVQPASITGGGRAGRLYLGRGCRLTGCHLDLSQGDIFIGAGTAVDPFASISGPLVVGKNSSIRTGARVRGNCIFGDRVVVGGEVKSSILMDEASFPHQCYVGDSICGFRTHFGNGATSANLGIYEGMKEESQFSPLTLLVPDTTTDGRLEHKRVSAGTAKLGIIMGDFSQVGCNSVSDPATFLGPRTLVYALTSLRKGFYGPDEALIRTARNGRRRRPT